GGRHACARRQTAAHERGHPCRPPRTHHHTKESPMSTRPMPSPLRYDLMLWVASRGRERVFRDRQVDLARIATGEAVLDVGCGTGSLAIAAARRVGERGVVHGVDPSAELLARARKKARRAGVEVTFAVARGEELPL